MTKQFTAELLPCPFCGSDRIGENSVSNTGGYLRYKFCRDCGARSHAVQTPIDDPGVEWNRRQAAATERELEQVRQRLAEAEKERDAWKKQAIRFGTSLMDIRDSTHKSALMLRSHADAALSSQQTSRDGEG